MDMVTQTYNPSTQEVKVFGQCHKSKASLDYKVKTYLSLKGVWRNAAVERARISS